MSVRIRIHFDAACHNIEGHDCPMGLGVAVFIDDEYQDDLSLAIGHKDPINLGTSNIGEWAALVDAMRVAVEMRREYKDGKFSVIGDSQLVVNQFNKIWQIKQDKFKPYYEEAHKLAEKAKIREIHWVPRERNQEADDLSKQGLMLMKEELKVIEQWISK